MRTSIFFAALVAVPANLRAVEAPPILLVPPSQSILHVAAPLQKADTPETARAWQLVEIDNAEVSVPAQVVPAIGADGSAVDQPGRLLAVIPPRDGANAPRRFRLEGAADVGADAGQGFRFEDVSQTSLKLVDGEAPVLVYNHGLITNEQVPQRDHRRSRACYIHPLWGLSGEVLTDDFPRDHYHHHGVFWTWPHIGIDGQHYNLWDGTRIQDRFVRWICRQAGPVAAVLAVENGWFVGEKKVMVERVWMRVYKVSDDARVLDLEFTWIPTDKPITLQGAEGKSYGGLTVRFAPPSAQDPATSITVPSGRASDDLPDTPLAWADFTSKLGGTEARSGATIMVHPNHPDYPPTWLTRFYGPLCVGWPGVKAQTFEPGKPIRLDYRIWIHKSAVELEDLKQAYEAYGATGKVSWEQ